MERESSIKEKLNSIFKKRLNIDFLKNEDLVNESLFSEKVRMSPSSLVYIFFDVEREFGINVNEKYIIEDGFATFNSITEVIKVKQKL